MPSNWQLVHSETHEHEFDMENYSPPSIDIEGYDIRDIYYRVDGIPNVDCLYGTMQNNLFVVPRDEDCEFCYEDKEATTYFRDKDLYQKYTEYDYSYSGYYGSWPTAEEWIRAHHPDWNDNIITGIDYDPYNLSLWWDDYWVWFSGPYVPTLSWYLQDQGWKLSTVFRYTSGMLAYHAWYTYGSGPYTTIDQGWMSTTVYASYTEVLYAWRYAYYQSLWASQPISPVPAGAKDVWFTDTYQTPEGAFGYDSVGNPRISHEIVRVYHWRQRKTVF